jgi:pyruvate dehydrogenase E1 component alpha subunit
MARGFDPRDVLLYWMGNEISNHTPEDLNLFSVSISVGTHIPHATGLAWASKLKDENRAFLCNFGDGATSQGDFHEGLNFAGVFDVPAIFLCNNNHWAISASPDQQTGSKTYAQKAEAYGFEGILVDGMDPLAMYKVLRDAVKKAKNPADREARPTLIEAKMYRYGPHTTADDPTVYRDEEELERWKDRDPITRFETFLRDRGLLNDDRVAEIEKEVQEVVADAIDRAEAYEPDPYSMFEHVYEEETPRLREQHQSLKDLQDRHGEELFED